MEPISGVCTIILEDDTLAPMSAFGDIVSSFYFDPLIKIFIVDYRKSVITAVDAFLHYDGDAQSVTEALSKPALYIVRDGLDGKIMISFDEVPEGTDPRAITHHFLAKKTGSSVPPDVLFHYAEAISSRDYATVVIYTGTLPTDLD